MVIDNDNAHHNQRVYDQDHALHADAHHDEPDHDDDEDNDDHDEHYEHHHHHHNNNDAHLYQCDVDQHDVHDDDAHHHQPNDHDDDEHDHDEDDDHDHHNDDDDCDTLLFALFMLACHTLIMHDVLITLRHDHATSNFIIFSSFAQIRMYP